MTIKPVSNKRGTTTMFLAIILSALILVECTYISIVADLDRRYTICRALKQQVDCYLAQYDRELFNTYGIYAFNAERIDDDVFRSVLQANGVDMGETLCVSGIYSFDTEDIRRAISVYYSYRTSGIIINRFSDFLITLLENADSSGLIEKIREFTSSQAATVLNSAIEGAADITDAILSVAEYTNIDSVSDKIQDFRTFISHVRSLKRDVSDMIDDFDPSDLSFGTTAVDTMYDLYDIQAQFADTFAFHSCAAHYAAYNFDCTMSEDDHALNGTGFDHFHEGNLTDSEYILTGLNGPAAFTAATLLIFEVLFLKEFLIVYTDPELMEVIDGIAEVLMVIVDIISGGTVVLPFEVYQIMITSLFAEYYASGDLNDVLRGGKTEFLSIGDITVFEMGYRDFLCLFLNFIPDNIMLERMADIFARDFPDHAVEVEVTAEYKGTQYSYSQYYELYDEG